MCECALCNRLQSSNKMSYHLVLDDPATMLRLAEGAGACDAFYEAVVVRRVDGACKTSKSCRLQVTNCRRHKL